MKEKSYNNNRINSNLYVRLLSILIIAFPATVEHVFAQTSKNATINVRDVNIPTALDELQKNTQMHCVYEKETINTARKVTLEYEKAPLTVVLDDLAGQALLGYEIKDNSILFFPQKDPASKQKSQDIRISGKVFNEQGAELIGVNITIPGTTKRTTTDADGRYEIEAAPGDMLLFSYVGMENKLVTVPSDKRTVDVKMMSNQVDLGEVVVTGYQTLSKERATGSYSVISEKDTKGKLESDIISRLEGLVGGMNKTGQSRGYGQVSIRGITTYQGTRTPLYVVDGLPFDGDIATINPSDVKNITVLKDATAASIYGAQSANGVIVITTKRGGAGSTRITYSGSMNINPKPDLDYLSLISSSELVDLQIEGFNYYHGNYNNLNKRRAINPVVNILYLHERGEIDNLEEALLPYRNRDNRRQLEKEFARTAVSHQHNLSVSGGTEKNQYLASINYTKETSNQKYEYKDRIGFNIKNNTNLFNWLVADIGVSTSFGTEDNNNSSYTMNSSRRGGHYVDLIYSYPSYNMLRDTDGTPLPWARTKSDYELERLKSIGLADETYYPVEDKHQEHFISNTNYYRIHAGLLFNITNELSVDVKYQTEKSDYKERKLYSDNSWAVRNMINEAAVYDEQKKELTLNVPKGGQLDEFRQDSYSYTLRAQANYNRTDGAHDVKAIMGAERRLRRYTGNRVYYMGYDDNSLVYEPVNPKQLSSLSGTEALSGGFSWRSEQYNYLNYHEDRYVSFYGNASYTYNNRYAATGSIRIDKSDLYATDPNKQNRPLWSIGGSWHLSEEKFMDDIGWINLLKLRTTYGIGGNIPKLAGPYMNIMNGGYNDWVGGIGSYISNPPNPRLRWEKTATVNVGIDFSLLNYRLNGAVNYYNRKSTDLLGYRNTDPTLGWSSLLINYGMMNNRGIDIELHTVNIQNRDFSWETNLVGGYNKNELTDLEGTEESVFYYTAYNVAAIGYPLNSLFSYRYAGLNPQNGNVLVYNKKGEKVTNVESIDDLVYSGTRVPKYTMSLKNAFGYKNLDLTFMFVYYGGHVMRDVVADFIGGAPSSNMTVKSLTHWRKPGDEKIPGMGPSLNRNISYSDAQTWYSADIHVKKADYIKLRDISLSYNIPKKWLRKNNLRELALTCQISNLWWWAANGDIDPEAYSLVGYGSGAFALPNPVTYTFGLLINF